MDENVDLYWLYYIIIINYNNKNDDKMAAGRGETELMYFVYDILWTVLYRYTPSKRPLMLN
jgi:hypothetical protein